MDEILKIADDARNAWMERQGDEEAGLPVPIIAMERIIVRPKLVIPCHPPDTPEKD